MRKSRSQVYTHMSVLCQCKWFKWKPHHPIFTKLPRIFGVQCTNDLRRKEESGMSTLSLSPSETCVRENPDDFLAKVILEFFINCLVLHFLKACEIKIVTISAPRAQLPAGKSSIGKSTAETRQVKRQPRSVSMLTPRSRQGFPPAPFFLTKRSIQKWPKNWVYLQFGPKFPY